MAIFFEIRKCHWNTCVTLTHTLMHMRYTWQTANYYAMIEVRFMQFYRTHSEEEVIRRCQFLRAHLVSEHAFLFHYFKWAEPNAFSKCVSVAVKCCIERLNCHITLDVSTSVYTTYEPVCICCTWPAICRIGSVACDSHEKIIVNLEEKRDKTENGDMRII